MAGELHHIDPGDSLGYAEYQDTTIHNLDGQAAGDIIIARSATVLERLALGTGVLTSDGTDVTWATVPTGVHQVLTDTLSSGTFTATSWTDTGLEVTITPTISSNPKMILMVSGGGLEVTDSNDHIEVRFVRGDSDTEVGLAVWLFDDATPSSYVTLNFMTVDIHGAYSSGSITYKVQVRCTGGSAAYRISNTWGTPASFAVMEVT